MDMGADERKGARRQADIGAEKALVPHEEAGIMGEKPESPKPGSSQVGGGRTREEGNAALSPRSVAHLLPLPAGRVCGPRWPRRRLGFPRSLAWPNSAPFLVKQRPPPAQAAMPPPTAGTASESGCSKPGGGECPRNASRSTEGSEMLRVPGCAWERGEHWLGHRRSSSSAAKKTPAHPGQRRCTNTGTLIADTPTHTLTTKTAPSHTRLRGQHRAHTRAHPAGKEPHTPATRPARSPARRSHALGSSPAAQGTPRCTALVGWGGSAHRACGPTLGNPAGLQYRARGRPGPVSPGYRGRPLTFLHRLERIVGLDDLDGVSDLLALQDVIVEA